MVNFIVDYIDVLIECDANFEKPTFELISILVKPRFQREEMDGVERKQCQVDLADELVERLLKLWYEMCPRVEYVQKVISPWLASYSRPPDNPSRSVELVELKKWVTEYVKKDAVGCWCW
jgi:hypothetical protein